MNTRVAIVGAGYAGLACAVELCDAGHHVDIYEASRTLGGRARAVEIDGQTLDNGAHIFVGAYRETLRLMRKVDAGDTLLKRLPLHLEFAEGVRIVAPRLPKPLHLAWALLTARGLLWREKIAAIRFMRALEKARFRLPRDITAKQLIANQPAALRAFLWEPLCLAALNTPVAIASAQVFLNVLRDSLAADRAASDLLLPATDFTRLFPEPAAAYIEKHGGRVLRSTRVCEIRKVDAGWTLCDETYDHVVLAVAPYHLGKLLETHPACADIVRQVETFAWQPITTVYLAYPPEVRLPCPMLGLANAPAQWLFDRGALCGQHGLIAAIISGTGPHQALSHDELAAALHRQIAARIPDLSAPLHHHVFEEKRASFACTPNLERPPTATPEPGLWLAGDHVQGDYPATIEGAVRSGIAAAKGIGAGG